MQVLKAGMMHLHISSSNSELRQASLLQQVLLRGPLSFLSVPPLLWLLLQTLQTTSKVSIGGKSGFTLACFVQVHLSSVALYCLF